jgi:rare lipoprotein A
MDREHFGLSTTGIFRLFLLLAAGFWLSACGSVGPRYAVSNEAPRHGSADGLRGTMKPYQVAGRWYYPAQKPRSVEVGTASWYGGGHEGPTTANGEVFDTDLVAAAHKTLPLPCFVEVTNLDNGKRIKLRVNDRGPFVDGRIIDLTHAAAVKLGFADKGTARVRVRYLGPATPVTHASGGKSRLR